MSHTFTAEELQRSAESRRRYAASRFWDRMDRSGGPDACWVWTGARNTPDPGRVGYGIFQEHGRVVYAHRRALERSLGRSLAAGEWALHHCDSPPCCNPAHLFVGTQVENMADMKAKGRHGGTLGMKLPSRRKVDGCTRSLEKRASTNSGGRSRERRQARVRT